MTGYNRTALAGLLSLAALSASADVVTYRIVGTASDPFGAFGGSADLPINAGGDVQIDLAINYLPVAAIPDADPSTVTFADQSLIQEIRISTAFGFWVYATDSTGDTEEIRFRQFGGFGEAYFDVMRPGTDAAISVFFTGPDDTAFFPVNDTFPGTPVAPMDYNSFGLVITDPANTNPFAFLRVFDADGMLEIVPAPSTAALPLSLTPSLVRRRRAR